MRLAGILGGVLAACLMLSACSGGQSAEDARREVAAFHRHLDTGDHAAIWKNAALEVRASSTEQTFTRLLARVHRQLGRVIESKQVGWKTESTTSGSFTTLTMATRFARGAGQEEFVFRQTDKGLKLAGYHISSQALKAD